MHKRSIDYLESVALDYFKHKQPIERNELLTNLKKDITGVKISDKDFDFDTEIVYGKNIPKEYKNPANKRHESEVDKRGKSDDYKLY